MKVVLAEKPSVARDLARELNATQRREGYLEGNGWAVTWAFGHMVELKEPEDYDPALKQWTLESLPIVPEKFQLRARGEKDARKQLNIIRDLFKAADEIVCATDAGREGELIFRYILEWARARRKPCRRLWISSLTPESIRKGFAGLHAASAFDNLYRAARCRSESDWIVGLNATRFFTVRYGARGTLWSLGRVQTPVLAMIVARDRDIDAFTPEDYWEVHTRYRGGLFKYEKGRFTKREAADALLEKISGADLTVTDLTVKEEKTPPPLLFDLTGLQKEMNARHGMTADQTLRGAQSLYEKKHITYPRTDSRYLSRDMEPELPRLLEHLKRIREPDIAPLDLAHLPVTRRIVNDARVTDHHAIIPTEVIATRLHGDEAPIYEAVVTRFIAAFYPHCVKQATAVFAEIREERFKATGTVMLDPGWRRLIPPRKKAAKRDEDQELPRYEIGESGPHEPGVVARKTKPPKRFSEASLLQMMETAGKDVEEEALREALKDKGIGTPATRASIIETLIQRRYVRREKKNLLSTDSGRHLVALVQDPQLKSPEMTGEWEARLKAIETGRYDPAAFMKDVVTHTRAIIGQGPSLTNLGPCPRCGQPIIRGKRNYGCSAWKSGCTYVIDQETLGCTLAPEQISELLYCGRSMKPVLREIDGRVSFFSPVIDPEGAIRLDPVDTPADSAESSAFGACPVCAAAIRDRPKSWSCSNWENGCPFVVWKTMAGKKIPKTAVKQLLKTGRSAPLDGFKSRAGKPFSAYLQLVDGTVKFGFPD